MKKLRLTAILLAFTLFLAACATADTPATTPAGGTTATEQAGGDTAAPAQTPATDEQIEIRVAWWGSQVRHDRTMEVINMFMAEYPHISVQAEFYDSAGYWTALNTLAVAGDVWDVFQLGSNFPVYRDNILVLNDLIAQGHIDISQTTQDFIDITSDRGDIVGISNGVNAWGIAYDPAIFEAAGAALPHSHWTWDEFETAALLIHDQLGIWGMSQFGNNPSIVLTQYMFQQGIEFWHPEDESQLGFDDPSVMVGFFEMWRNLVQAGAAPDPGEAMLITDIEGDPVVTGDAAMTYVASNQFIALANAADRPLRMVPLPSHGPGSELGSDIVSSQMFSIANNSAHPEAAAAFINFFQNSIAANQVLLGERGVPIMEHVRDTLQEEAEPIIAETYAFISMLGDLGAGMGVIVGNPAQGEVEDFANLLLEQVVFGMITPEQAAQQLFDFALSVI
ncbi:MAG: extracellular solute-binding protein [Defluviitaleaceae bacterium]|nr:extracellular solute-binding protein [Defluviitaleaceae bacterium]